MKAGNGFKRWRLALGALAVGVFAFSLSLQGDPMGKAQRRGSASPLKVGKIRGMSVTQVPWDRPCYAHTSETVLLSEKVGPGQSLLWVIGGDESFSGVASPLTGGPSGECELAIECDDCNPCTTDTCCVGDEVPPCTPETCVYTDLLECDICDDALYCNGRDRCDASGTCVLASALKAPVEDPCAAFANLICDEEDLGSSLGECAVPCRAPGDCVTGVNCCDNGIDCDGAEVCQFTGLALLAGEGGECVYGANAGGLCQTDVTCGFCDGGIRDGLACDYDTTTPAVDGCPDGQCGYCGGVCRTPAGPFCGVNGYCEEGLNPGVPDETCGNGRCCIASACSRETLALCAGDWLQVGDELDTPDDDGFCGVQVAGKPNAGEDFRCPHYESGITSGTILGEIGPAGVATCRPYAEIGDDYELTNMGGKEWLEATTIRFIGGWVTGTESRMRVTFYDSQGRFIEDVITEPTSDGTFLRTVIFSEKPVIPKNGYIGLKAAVEFSPSSLQTWVHIAQASPNAVNTGFNDPNVMWIDGAISGKPVQLGSDPGVLAFEIIGVPTDRPTEPAATSRRASARRNCSGYVRRRATSSRVLARRATSACTTRSASTYQSATSTGIASTALAVSTTANSAPDLWTARRRALVYPVPACPSRRLASTSPAATWATAPVRRCKAEPSARTVATAA